MLKIFKSNPDATIPSYATEKSACFDICACISKDSVVKAKFPATLRVTENDVVLSIKDGKISIPPGARALVPTGLKFDIPSSHSIRLHPRSGLAFKNGLTLSNCEGVIDEDYIEEVLVSVCNNSSVDVIIGHGDRICQAELVKDTRIEIIESTEAPLSKSSRTGGFGSTGV